MEKKLILIPDVHGRTFWKEAIPYIQEGVPTVFLGDYLDPYPHEGISREDAITNFKEILELAKRHRNITLLYGNHDTTYMWPEYEMCHSRTDYKNRPIIHKLFRDNINRFQLYSTAKIGEALPFLFSHAGVHSWWAGPIMNVYNMVSVLDVLYRIDNDMHLDTPDPKAVDALMHITRHRGGYDMAGSPIWADIHEYNDQSSLLPGFIQVVGHSMQIVEAEHEPYWMPGTPVVCGYTYPIICIDCMQCFYIDETGAVRYLSDDTSVYPQYK